MYVDVTSRHVMTSVSCDGASASTPDQLEDTERGAAVGVPKEQRQNYKKWIAHLLVSAGGKSGAPRGRVCPGFRLCHRQVPCNNESRSLCQVKLGSRFRKTVQESKRGGGDLNNYFGFPPVYDVL